jgi:hypothetical protein
MLLKAKVDAPLANFTARLEDVAPDGQVSLVTGGIINGSHARSTDQPERMVPGREYALNFELHFTTWTFQPGHRIRVAVANAQFPMIWPTPYPLTTTLRVGGGGSHLELPVVPLKSAYPVPDLPKPEPRAERPDVVYHRSGHHLDRVSYQPVTGVTTVEWSFPASWNIGAVRFDYTENETYQTSDLDPSRSSWVGRATHHVQPPGRDFLLETTIDIQSDSTAFHVTVTRDLSSRGKKMRHRQWKEAIPREWH